MNDIINPTKPVDLTPDPATALREASPPIFPTTEQTAAVEKAREETAPGLFQAVGDAVSTEWALPWLLRQYGAEDRAVDPNYAGLTDERLKAYAKVIPEEHLDAFSDARSEADELHILSGLKDRLEVEKRLGALGWQGVGLRALVGTVDPVAILATVVTEGALGPAIYGTKALRLTRAVGAGLMGGVSNAALQAYITSQDPIGDPLDILYAGAAGVAFGGAFGAVRSVHPRERAVLGSLAYEAERRQGEAAGLKPTADAAGIYEAPRSSDARSMVEPLPEEPAGSLSAAASGFPREPLSPSAKAAWEAAYEANPPKIARGGFGMVDMLGRDDNPLVRQWAFKLAESGVGITEDGRALPFSASEDASRLFRTSTVKLAQGYNPAFDGWLVEQAKATGRTGLALRLGGARERFNTEVARTVRREPGAYSQDPHVNAAADTVRALHADLLRVAKEAGVKGFDEVAEDGRYLMRTHNHASIDRLVARYGNAQVTGMLTRSLLKGSAPDALAPEDAGRIAKAYLNHVQRRGAGADMDTARMFSGSNTDYLAGVLRTEGMGEADVSRITSRLRTTGEGGNARTRHRVTFDEAHGEDLKAGDGQVERVGFEDLLQNDAEALALSYARSLTGWAAMAKRGIPDQAAWVKVVDDIRLSEPGRDMTGVTSKMETLFKSVVGQPLSEATQFTEGLRLMRDYNFVRLMGQVGFAQVPEFGALIAHGGLRGMVDNMPALGDILRVRRVNGEATNQLTRELEALTGFGADRFTRRMSGRFDESGPFMHSPLGGLWEKADKTLKTAKAITADLSLMAPITAFQQRLAARVMVSNFADMAAGGKVNAKRLATLGMDEAMTRRVLAEVKANVTTEAAILGRRVTGLNMDRWGDQEAASAFVDGVYRWTRRAIQENDVGNLAQWMTTDVGKVIVQFRTFAAVAWSKQLMHGLHLRDGQTFVGWSAAVLLGGLSYVAQTLANAPGKADAGAFLEERLELDEVAKAAFNRAGWASLVPMGVDAVWADVLRFDPIFRHGRSSGLASNPLGGNPTADLIFNALGRKVPAGVLAPVLNPDAEFDQGAAKGVMAALAFQNLLGVRNVTQWVIEGALED